MPVVVKGLCHVYRRGEPAEARALDGIDLTIHGGEFLLVAGANGSGKTTLLHCLSGVLRPAAGRVAVDGTTALAVQFPERALFAGTVFDDIAFGPRNAGSRDIPGCVREAARAVGLDEGLFGRHPGTLSHGQRRLAALAGVVAVRPRYLFLDEPMAGLDPAAKDHMVSTLARLNREGTTIVVASHDLAHFMGACDRMLVMAGGKIVFDGVPDGLVSREDVPGLALPPSVLVARWLKGKGVDVPWNVRPEAAAAHARRLHEGVD